MNAPAGDNTLAYHRSTTTTTRGLPLFPSDGSWNARWYGRTLLVGEERIYRNPESSGAFLYLGSIAMLLNRLCPRRSFLILLQEPIRITGQYTRRSSYRRRSYVFRIGSKIYPLPGTVIRRCPPIRAIPRVDDTKGCRTRTEIGSLKMAGRSRRKGIILVLNNVDECGTSIFPTLTTVLALELEVPELF